METTYAYLAGAVDADGFISIGRKAGYRVRDDGTRPVYYVLKLGLSETSPVIPDLLQETFPAWRGGYTPKNAAHKPWYIWQATNQKAEAPLRALLPYLRLKKEQAELGLRFLALLKEQNAGRFMANPVTPDQEAERQSLYQTLTRLNSPRNRRVHFEGTPERETLQATP